MMMERKIEKTRLTRHFVTNILPRSAMLRSLAKVPPVIHLPVHSDDALASEGYPSSIRQHESHSWEEFFRSSQMMVSDADSKESKNRYSHEQCKGRADDQHCSW